MHEAAHGAVVAGWISATVVAGRAGSAASGRIVRAGGAVNDGKVQRSKHAGARQGYDADKQKSANNAPAYETAKTHDPKKVDSARPDASFNPDYS